MPQTVQTFTLNRQQLEKIRIDLTNEGVQLVGDSGNIDKMGCKVKFEYVEPTLTVTVIHHPFLVSDGYVENKINTWFGQENEA
jgi:hypothetical protein